jgi:hypothetical protein
MAAPLDAHMTDVEAINMMLRSINEQPIQSLNSGQIDAEQAEAILTQVSREIQSQGWHANTRRSVVLTQNAATQFVVPINVLKIDSVNPDSGRQTSTPAPSAFYNVGLRRNAANDGYLLYDIDNDTELWPTPTTMTVDIVEFLPFNELPHSLQTHIYTAAAHRFQKAAVASTVLFEMTREDVEDARATAIQNDMENDDRNMIRNSRASWEVAYRYNPLYNT